MTEECRGYLMDRYPDLFELSEKFKGFGDCLNEIFTAFDLDQLFIGYERCAAYLQCLEDLSEVDIDADYFRHLISFERHVYNRITW